MPDRQLVIDRLRQPERLQGQPVLLGFDAFIDLRVRAIQRGRAGAASDYFDRMELLGQFLIDRAGRNGSVELELLDRSSGGNAPNVALALSELGLLPECIGPFGQTAPDKAFGVLAERGRLHATGEPGLSYAFEFDNGKVFFALNRGNNAIDWRRVLETVARDPLLALVQGAKLLCFLNWSELPASTSIYRGFLEAILPRLDRRLPLLVDLADCARRSEAELSEVLQLLSEMADYLDVTLSLNHNEASMACAVSGIPDELAEAERARRLRDQLGIRAVSFHHREASLLATTDGVWRHRTCELAPARIHTGAGDNFNAGLCLGELLELPAAERLFLAAMLSGHYVERGRQASPAMLIDYIEAVEAYEEEEL